MPANKRTPAPISTLGRYRILGVLGEGGMGIVYEAEHDNPNRVVALKVIRPDFVSAELVRRFALESEVLGRLQHPGIAQIYEAGTADGPHGTQSFFAMELVRGEALMEYANAHALSLQERLTLFAKVCDAVHYAHQQGVIHRDLKPANILVDASGNPKVLDFGVARVTDSDLQGTRQTSVGEMIGTLQYMSPEQIAADPLSVDARSDVYALGVLLYELVSGRLPYDLEKKAIYEAARVIQMQEPLPLSSINRKWRGDVEIIVAKALEKEAERRYSSADVLASDVRRFLHDEPIVARPASAWYQLRKFARRNRPLVGGLTVAAAVLVLGASVSMWQAVRATNAERLAESRRGDAEAATALAEQRRSEAELATRLAEQRLVLADSALRAADSSRADALREQQAAMRSASRAQAEASKAQAVTTFLQDMLASAEPQNARGEELSVRGLLDRAADGMAAGELTRQPEVRAAVEATIGRTYFGLGVYDKARRHLDTAYAVQRRTAGPTNDALGAQAAELGRVAFAAGDFAEAERRLPEAVSILQRTRTPGDDKITGAMVDLASVRYKQARYDEAEALYRRAVQLAVQEHGSSHPVVADRLVSLGSFLGYTLRSAEALPLLQDAVRILTDAYGDVHPQVVQALVSLADVQGSLSLFAQKEGTARRAMSAARTLYSDAHPTLADVVDRVGEVLREQQQPEAAEPFLREAMEMRIALLGSDHPDVQLSRTAVGRINQSIRNFAAADSLFTAALTARRNVLGNTSPAVASSLDDLAGLAMARQDWAGAVGYLEESLPIWREAGIVDQELYAMGVNGMALLRLDRLNAADSVLTEVLTRRKALFGDLHWTISDSYDRLGAVAAAREQYARAESLSVLSVDIQSKLIGPRSFHAATRWYAVAYYRAQKGDTAGASAPVRESLEILAALRPPTDLNIINGQRLLAEVLCATGSATQGDSLIQVARRNTPADTTQALLYRVEGVRGFCLTRQQRYAEAEPILLDAEAGLRRLNNSINAPYHTALLNQLVSLYEQWGKPEQVTAWKKQ